MCLPEDSFLCSYNRHSLGMGWKAPKQCQHPDHDVLVRKKASPTRKVLLQMRQCFNTTNQSLPIGSVF